MCPDGKLDVGGSTVSRCTTGGRVRPTTAEPARKISTSPTSTVAMTSGARLRSGRTYHEKLKALAANPF